MKITKLGHCCLLIETKGKRVLTDPGSYTVEAHSKLENIDYVLFTHEHQDHYHIESLKVILAKNPNVIIYTNSSVSDLLTKEGIKHIQVNNGDSIMLGDISVHGIGDKHAQMHSSIPLSSNLGFFIDNTLWYPGDAFTHPHVPVDVLALPTAGPWMKLSEALAYASEVKPVTVIPVHDGIYARPDMMNPLIERVLSAAGIRFVQLPQGETITL
jgi:L-ascorbate metabolism protein UlaG (beta-lactamase superfamily)